MPSRYEFLRFAIQRSTTSARRLEVALDRRRVALLRLGRARRRRRRGLALRHELLDRPVRPELRLAAVDVDLPVLPARGGRLVRGVVIRRNVLAGDEFVHDADEAGRVGEVVSDIGVLAGRLVAVPAGDDRGGAIASAQARNPFDDDLLAACCGDRFDFLAEPARVSVGAAHVAAHLHEHVRRRLPAEVREEADDLFDAVEGHLRLPCDVREIVVGQIAAAIVLLRPQKLHQHEASPLIDPRTSVTAARRRPRAGGTPAKAASAARLRPCG